MKSSRTRFLQPVIPWGVLTCSTAYRSSSTAVVLTVLFRCGLKHDIRSHTDHFRGSCLGKLGSFYALAVRDVTATLNDTFDRSNLSDTIMFTDMARMTDGVQLARLIFLACLILKACATSGDSLLKNRGGPELPHEETWRDLACVKVPLSAHIWRTLPCYGLPCTRTCDPRSHSGWGCCIHAKRSRRDAGDGHAPDKFPSMDELTSGRDAGIAGRYRGVI
jgi:hypothetical protein